MITKVDGDVSLLPNAFWGYNDLMHKGLLFDTFASKKYVVPYDVALRGKVGRLKPSEVLKINDILSSNPEIPEEESDYINELRFIMTNKCNFSCTYCFANHGTYGLPTEFLSKDTAQKVIDYYYNHHNTIKQISFFGGEPCLNMECIRFICEYARHLWMDKCPKFSIVTNGSLLNDEIVKIIIDNDISCVVSIDGPKNINDLQRISNDNKSSFEKIDNALKNYGDKIKLSIEATYTSYHEKNNISRKNLYRYLNERYHTDRILIADVCVPQNYESTLSVKPEIIPDSLTRLFFSNEFEIDDYIFQLVKIYLNSNKQQSFCGAGRRNFTVDMHGDVYPCHFFVGKEPFKLFSALTLESYNHTPDIFSKKKDECIECKYKKFCSICPAERFLGKDSCSLSKYRIEYFLENIINTFLGNRERYELIINACINYGRSNTIKERIQYE